MFDLTTTKGNASFETALAASEWVFQMQPSAASVNGEHFDWESDDDEAVELRNIRNAIRAALKRAVDRDAT